MTLASTQLSLEKVPKIFEDEGTWFADFLQVEGTLCGPKSKLGVQLALVPTARGEDCFDLPDSPQREEMIGLVQEEGCVKGNDGASEKIVDLLEEAWTAGTIGRSPSVSTPPAERVQPLAVSTPEAVDEKALEAPLSLRIHLHKICDLHNFNLLSLTGNTSIYAILYHKGQWKKSKTIPKSSTPVFNDIFEFQVFDPTSYITIALVEEVQMPFSGMKERFRTTRLLGKILVQPSCFPANKKCHLKMNILSNKLIQRTCPYVLASVCLSYQSLGQLLDIYWTPADKSGQVPVMDSMPDELKSLSTEDLMDLWSKSGDYSLSASITSARRTLRRAKNAKQETDLILDPFVKAIDFVQSWKQPLASLLVLISYCRLCLTPKYIPSALLLMIAAIPLYQYQSNFRFTIIFKSKFVHYKTWRISDMRQLEGEAPESAASSPRSDTGGGTDQEHWIQSPGESYDEEIAFDKGGSHDNSSDSKESPIGVRMRIKTVARISQEFSNHVARISSYVEKVLHLLLWTDPRLSTIFVAACLSGALLLVIIPPSYIALLAGCYLMRPPSLRTNQSGIIMNLFSRLPDNSDIF